MSEPLIIGIAMRNGATTIGRALASIFAQELIQRPLEVLIVDDSSTDAWQPEVLPFLHRRELRILPVACGSAWATRNEMLRDVRTRHGRGAFLARLDCDDELAGPGVLRRVDQLLRRHDPDVLFLGNRLREKGQVLDRVNHATAQLIERPYLAQRLAGMADGDPSAELPSCNTVIRVGIPFQYPSVPSAEDHWLAVDLLMRPGNVRRRFDEQLLWATYSLSGNLTAANRKAIIYRESRLALLHVFRQRTA